MAGVITAGWNFFQKSEKRNQMVGKYIFFAWASHPALTSNI
jgi:hypothetical protein